MFDNGPSPRMSPAGVKAELGPKRMYKLATSVASEDGYSLQLDGRGVRTPARSQLTVTGAAMADALVEEWLAQGDHIDHQSMPMTRFANTAIDNVRGRETEIVEEIVAFAGSDLLCYRADTPSGLVSSQQAAWDPVLDWVHQTLGARFILAVGIVHAPQPQASLENIRDAVRAFDAFGLTGLHNMTTLTGSALLALACAHEFIAPEDTWTRAHVDEDWQISQWGPDEEAAARRAFRGSEFLSAYRFLTLSNDV